MHVFGIADTVIPVPNMTGGDVLGRWGDELRIERIRRNLTQADVASALKVTTPTISKLESGRAHFDTYVALAEHFGVKLTTNPDAAEPVGAVS